MENRLAFENLEYAAPGDLEALPNSPRVYPEAQIAAFVRVVEELGFYKPLVVDDRGHVVSGWPLVLAARELRLNRVPFVRAAGLSPEMARALAIADEKISEMAGWDNEVLKVEIRDLESFGLDVSLLGFSEDELAALFVDDDKLETEGETEDDEKPAPGPKPVSKAGDLWVCGDHLVLCGDSCSLENVERLVGAGGADMVWTDPPYNVAYENESAGSIQNDNMKAADFRQFLCDVFAGVAVAMKPGAPIYVAHAALESENFYGAFREAGFDLSSCLVWVKTNWVIGWGHYHWQHEPILYGSKPGASRPWYGGRNKSSLHDCEDLPFVIRPDGSVMIDAGASSLVISGNNLQVEELVGTVDRHSIPNRNKEHPTMKPVSLVVGHLKNSSRRGEVVFDPFGGSGTTMIAAQKLGRRARLIELDPRFVDVIVKRWQDFTGQTATLQASGATFAEIAELRGVA